MIPIKDLPTHKFYLDAYHVSFIMPTRWTLEETIRIFDRGEDNSSTPLREPIESKGASCKKYENTDVVLHGDTNQPSCQKRQCIEEMYIKVEEDNDRNEICTFRNTATYIIYIVLLGLFTLIPLGLVLILLYRRDKK